MDNYNSERARWGRPEDRQPGEPLPGTPFASPYLPAPNDAPTGIPVAAPFVGQFVAPPRRITTPLSGPPFVAPPPPTVPYAAYAPATLTPVPRRRSRNGVSGLLLTAMLILGLLAGGIGGGATAWMLGGAHTSPSAAPAAPPAPPAAPVTLNPSGIANGTANPIHDLYTRVANSVVSIQVTLGGGGRFGAGGEGSGIVVDKTHVLTNYHVVEGANTISIILADGTSVDGKLAGSAPQDDLAVVTANLPADKVQPATLGDSDSAQVGDEVVAIGNPFGLDHTVTAGIISYVNRSWTDGSHPVHNMIQTDAPINPGNSGGPLFNLQGQVIGVTTAIESPVRGSVGVGFAIPVNRAKTLLPQLNQGATVKRVMLGLQGVALTPDIATQLNIPITKGVLTAGVVAGGPAEKAGIQGAQPGSGKVGDIVTAIDGTAVASVADITNYLESKHAGDVVTLTIWRAGQTSEVKVTLAEWQDQTPQSQGGQPFPIPGDPNNPNSPNSPNTPPNGAPSVPARAWLGIRGTALDPTLAAQLKITVQQGVLVTQVIAGSPAEKAGVQGADPQSSSTVGDVITAINGTAVSSPTDLTAYLTANNKAPGDTVTLTIWRAGKTLDLKVTLANWPAQVPGPNAAPTQTP